LPDDDRFAKCRRPWHDLNMNVNEIRVAADRVLAEVERVDARRIRVTSPALLTPPGKGQRGPGCLHPDLVATMRWRDKSLLGICPGDHAADEACGLKNSTWSANFSKRTNRNF
jgi:hypothetical protein